jgi:hypothetical protein
LSAAGLIHGLINCGFEITSVFQTQGAITAAGLVHWWFDGCVLSILFFL